MITQNRRQRGSMSLTMLASVGGGVLFALSFANLARYISAENALEQAMQRIARCIDPTDAECSQLSAPPPSGSFDWYVNSTAQAETSWADRYRYTARLSRENWQLSFPAYEIHKVPLPGITWDEWELPLRRHQPVLNGYERRTAQIAAIFEPASTSFFAPLAEPNFPEFDPAYERDRRDQDPWIWTPRGLDVPGDVRRRAGSGQYVSHSITLPMQATWISETLRLSDEARERRNGEDDVEQFVTDWYEVPLLDGGTEPPVCQNSSGAGCDISYATGGSADDWFRRAHIAIKAFAVARRVSGDPEIKWAGSGSIAGSPDGWGLQLERVSPARWQAAAAQARAEGRPLSSIRIDRDDFECLGGRDWSEVERADGWKNFHLVLRGAVKRRPGDNALDVDPNVDPACPGGDRNHWNLTIARGGAYRIRGFLKTRGGTLEARVMLQSYFDNYARSSVPTEPFVCNTSVPLTVTAATAPGCEAACRPLLPGISSSGWFLNGYTLLTSYGVKERISIE